MTDTGGEGDCAVPAEGAYRDEVTKQQFLLKRAANDLGKAIIDINETYKNVVVAAGRHVNAANSEDQKSLNKQFGLMLETMEVLYQRAEKLPKTIRRVIDVCKTAQVSERNSIQGDR